MIDPYVLARPILQCFDPETAHEFALRALELNFVPSQPAVGDARLLTTLFGKPLAHPVGLAAGFDKNARVFARMYAQGLSFVEIGGVTPRPRVGNPRPRVFRLPEAHAVINRMGFPNDGSAVVLARLKATRAPGVLGINLAADVESADPIEDFTLLVARFAPHADFLTLDVSCPNTTNGQIFLEPVRLRELLVRVRALNVKTPIAAKLAPDVDEERLDALVDVLLEARIDGIILSNTTRDRPSVLVDPNAKEAGGLSGPPLFARSTAMLARVAARTRGRTTLIGVGGIASGADAYAKIRAGASVVQLYTGLIYEGPSLVTRIKRELGELLSRDGFPSIVDAVGADVS
ncbi:MAG TPA: quinone-dependent dihydroorotate dehydrogenase [Candidatus Baltobacteraceae bacterium]|nr:quinone-dependent dihydroorotate dehydrogenase [Candidatus Baltobacteraceae bacterium]